MSVHVLCSIFTWVISVFFFQAEDGIRDRDVTGVQTCALPISAKAVLRGKFIAIQAYLKKQEKSQINKQSLIKLKSFCTA